MQIANEFGREGGGLGSITGAGPPPDDFSYGAQPGAPDISLPGQAYIPPQAIPGGPTPSPGGLLPSLSSSGGAFIIGMIILGMSGFRA